MKTPEVCGIEFQIHRDDHGIRPCIKVYFWDCIPGQRIFGSHGIPTTYEQFVEHLRVATRIVLSFGIRNNQWSWHFQPRALWTYYNDLRAEYGLSRLDLQEKFPCEDSPSHD